MYSLTLWGRPLEFEPFRGNITRVASGWQRSTRAVGGYWSGGFVIHARDMSNAMMSDFFHRHLGCTVREYAAGGLLSWEGYIAEMRLVMDGKEKLRSLLPERWHNRVQVRYTWTGVVDTEAGGAYAWDPDAPNDSFKDESQDFSDWETNPAGADDARYRIVITCTDGTILWGFLGDAFTTTNTDDSIHIYERADFSDEGWVTDWIPGGRDSKTVASYTIENVEGLGQPFDTDWAENTDSSAQYGVMDYIETVGSLPTETADRIRDRHLTEFAWPRSALVGSAVIGGQVPENRLVVTVAGYVHSMNWKYLQASQLAGAYTLIKYLVGLSEFVTTGRVDLNEWAAKADCEAIGQRLGNLCADVIHQGDLGGNIWQGGVYGGKKFRYNQAPTTVDYRLTRRALTDKNGVPVLAPLVEPGFLVRISGALLAGQPPGSSNIWDDPQVAYVDEVEFAAPDKLKLRLLGEETGVLILLEQARMAGMMMVEV